LLGSDLAAVSEEVSAAVRAGQEHVNWRITHLFSLSERWPTPRNLRFNRALKVLDRVVYSIIEQRRSGLEGRTRDLQASPDGNHGNDLLTLLLEARDEDSGESMTDRQLRDEVMTIFLAGHDTTANALAWTWHLLGRNPEVEEQLQAEVDAVLRGRPPELSDISRLAYARMVLDESLRLYPPGWAVGRFPLQDDVASGYRIPAHSQVILSSYVTHRDPRFGTIPNGSTRNASGPSVLPLGRSSPTSHSVAAPASASATSSRSWKACSPSRRSPANTGCAQSRVTPSNPNPSLPSAPVAACRCSSSGGGRSATLEARRPPGRLPFSWRSSTVGSRAFPKQ